jgi:hypothetical protein
MLFVVVVVVDNYYLLTLDNFVLMMVAVYQMVQLAFK